MWHGLMSCVDSVRIWTHSLPNCLLDVILELRVFIGLMIGGRLAVYKVILDANFYMLNKALLGF